MSGENQKFECVPADIPTHQEFHRCVQKLRAFFESKGFIEVHTQNNLSILAACEDPTTMATYNYSGNVWPLPQTGQMWLEHYLLDHPEEKGFFACPRVIAMSLTLFRVAIILFSLCLSLK